MYPFWTFCGWVRRLGRESKEPFSRWAGLGRSTNPLGSPSVPGQGSCPAPLDHVAAQAFAAKSYTVFGIGVADGPPGVILGVGELTGPPGVKVGVGEEGENVGVMEGVMVGPELVGVLDGVDGVKLGSGDSTGVVGPGVGGVGVAELPRMVRLPGTKSIAVKVLLPCETRAWHSTAV